MPGWTDRETKQAEIFYEAFDAMHGEDWWAYQAPQLRRKLRVGRAHKAMRAKVSGNSGNVGRAFKRRQRMPR